MQQFYYDDLPIWGFLGKLEKTPAQGAEQAATKYFLFTHIHFDILYNKDRVIQVRQPGCVVRSGAGYPQDDRVFACSPADAGPARQVDISTDPTRTVDITASAPLTVEFTYAVKWKETDIPYERRMDKYSKYSFLPQVRSVSHMCH